MWTKVREKRGLAKVLQLALCVGSAIAFMFGFDMHEHIHYIVEAGESSGLDLIFFGLLTGLMIFLAIQTYELMQETKKRQAAEAAALTLAHTDTLTGLGNRRRLEEGLRVAEPGSGRSMIMVDLNDFKPVNDVFGHAAGDALLKEIAKRIVATAPAASLVCRIGGDEFAILTENAIDDHSVALLARKLHAAIATPVIVNNNEFSVSGSIGISSMARPERTGEEVLREADIALYRAKENRQQPFFIFEKSMEEEAYRRTHLEAKLRKAVELNAVKPFFQPLVNLKTSELLGFEALARWTDPEFGEISPVEFISLAEESGLINQLSESLLRQACNEALKWPKHVRLSFNLSPRQLRDAQIGLRIVSVLAATGLAPHRLEIEITESCLVDDMQTAIAILASLRGAGIRIAIDDFGTGYSSLYNLKEFKFDNLKIDRSFVRTLGKDKNNDVIINAILTMSKGLGLTTVAEGIESEAQLEALISSGCQTGQGFLFSKAISGEAALKLIEASTVVPNTATG